LQLSSLYQKVFFPRSILDAKGALVDLAQDLSERTQRWRQIETLCGFQILNSGSCLRIPTISTLEDFSLDDSLSVDDIQAISTPTRLFFTKV